MSGIFFIPSSLPVFPFFSSLFQFFFLCSEVAALNPTGDLGKCCTFSQCSPGPSLGHSAVQVEPRPQMYFAVFTGTRSAAAKCGSISVEQNLKTKRVFFWIHDNFQTILFRGVFQRPKHPYLRPCCGVSSKSHTYYI